MLTWYFYERLPLITNSNHCWQVPSFKPRFSKFEPNPFISLQVTVSKSNQPPNFLHRWKKLNFVCRLSTSFWTEKPYQKPWPSSINIIRTLLDRMERFRSGLPQSDVVVRAQKPYQVITHPNEITTPEMMNKIHDTVLNEPRVKIAWYSWDRIYLNWACGQYFAYTFMHERALCNMDAAIAHKRPQTDSCDHFGEKFGLF